MTTADLLPVTLLTGFLGSGKTTLLNQLLRREPLTAVVMNEFGEIGLDHQLLEDTRGPLALLSGGCVCCQVQGSLGPTLKNLFMARGATLPDYRRVIIETTGIADPAPILDVLLNDRWIAARHRMDGVITTVDCAHAPQQLGAYPEARRQVAVADRLLLTKSDQTTPEARAALEERLASLNPAAPRHIVTHGAIDPALILEVGLFNARDKHADVEKWLAHARYRPVARGAGLGGKVRPQPADGHDGRIRAFSLSFDEPLDGDGLAAALEMLQVFRAENLLRMKAIVHVAGKDAPVVLHAVQHVLYPPAELREWPDDDRRSRFVFITADLEEGFVRRLLDDFTHAAAGKRAAPALT